MIAQSYINSFSQLENGENQNPNLFHCYQGVSYENTDKDLNLREARGEPITSQRFGGLQGDQKVAAHDYLNAGSIL